MTVESLILECLLAVSFIFFNRRLKSGKFDIRMLLNRKRGSRKFDIRMLLNRRLDIREFDKDLTEEILSRKDLTLEHLTLDA